MAEKVQLQAEIKALTEWDISDDRSIEDIYNSCPDDDLKNQINEFREMDEWTGYDDIREDYTYKIRRINGLRTVDDFEHEALYIADQSIMSQKTCNELVGRKKLHSLQKLGA